MLDLAVYRPKPGTSTEQRQRCARASVGTSADTPLTGELVADGKAEAGVSLADGHMVRAQEQQQFTVGGALGTQSDLPVLPITMVMGSRCSGVSRHKWNLVVFSKAQIV